MPVPLSDNCNTTLMKVRRHHNNKGYRQIKSGNTYKSLQCIIKKLNLNVGGSNNAINDSGWIEEGKDIKKES